MPKRIPAVVRLSIVERYRDGDSISAIAKDIGSPRHTVRRILVEHGCEQRSSGGRPAKPLSEEQIEEIVRMSLRGVSQVVIAEKFGITQSRVSRTLIAADARVHTKRRVGIQHRAWTGGRRVLNDGYIRVLLERDDPLRVMGGRTGTVLEHRYLMARFLGRPLTEHETVHHLNGQPDDNRLENLQLRNGHHGRGIVLRCAACGSHDIRAVEIS